MANIETMTDEEYSRWMEEAMLNDGVDDDEIEYGEEEVEEEEVEDLEQPDEQDSDDDADMEVADEDEITEEDSDEAVDEPDGDIEPEEEQPEDVVNEAPTEVQPMQTYKFKANGREYEFSEDEIKKQFPTMFGQAMDYTKKMQAIKPWRKTIDAIEQAKLNHDDINLMIDVLKGDKGAIAEVLKRTNVDTLDIDTESKYTPKDYGRDDKALAVKDVIEEISADKEYDITYNVLSKEWDDKSFKEMTDNPELIRLLHIDVKSGMYDKLQPLVDKFRVMDRGRKSSIEYYKDAARAYDQSQRQEYARLVEADRLRVERDKQNAEKAKIADVKAKQVKIETVKQESVKRKAAAPTKKVAGKGITDYLADVNSMTDAEYNKWFNSRVK